jgi:hypothetical protein
MRDLYFDPVLHRNKPHNTNITAIAVIFENLHVFTYFFELKNTAFAVLVG